MKPKKERRIYTPEEKQHAIDLYFKNGCNLKKTVRELGYGKQIEELQSQKEAVERELSEMNAHKSTRHCEHNMNKAIFLSCFGDFSDFSYFFRGIERSRHPPI